MIKNIISSLLVAFTTTVFLLSCEKTKVTIPPEAIEFTNESPGSYFVTNSPTSVFKIPVGITSVPNADRTVQFSVSSPTGAAAGTQYTLDGNSVVIPAGQTIGFIDLKGIFSGYPAGRKDTLVFQLNEGEVPTLTGADEYKVILQKYCDVIADDFAGVYDNSFDTQDGSPDYGPYGTGFSNITSTGPTTANVRISNFWDVGGSITAKLDWTDPANFKTTIPAQFLYNDPTYGRATITGVGSGTFSSCDNTFTFSYTVTVAAGSFGNFITTIAR